MDSQNLETFLTSFSSIFLLGVSIVHLFLNKSGIPAFGPLFSIPATGWPGIQIEFFKFIFCNILPTPVFTEQVSVKIEPAFKLFLIEFNTDSKLLIGVAIITKSEFFTASSALLNTQH